MWSFIALNVPALQRVLIWWEESDTNSIFLFHSNNRQDGLASKDKQGRLVTFNSDCSDSSKLIKGFPCTVQSNAWETHQAPERWPLIALFTILSPWYGDRAWWRTGHLFYLLSLVCFGVSTHAVTQASVLTLVFFSEHDRWSLISESFEEHSAAPYMVINDYIIIWFHLRDIIPNGVTS